MDELPEEVGQLIENERHVAHLGTVHGNRPHVAPLWYRYDGQVIEIATTGRKLNNLRENSKVALSIQSSENGMPDWRVTVLGSAQVIDDDAESKAGRARIHEKYGIDPEAFLENVLVKIAIGSVCHKTF